MKIRRLLVILPLVMVAMLRSANTWGQGMPVYDNTNFISLVKQLVESGKQTSNLMKTVSFLKQQKENLEKVNGVIKQLNAVKELYKNNQRLYELVQNDLREILNSPYIKANEVERVTKSFNDIIDNSVASLAYIDQILSSDNLKMSDGERTTILKEKELESKEMVIEIEAKTQRYRDIISFRRMQDIINNRLAHY